MKQKNKPLCLNVLYKIYFIMSKCKQIDQIILGHVKIYHRCLMKMLKINITSIYPG